MAATNAHPPRTIKRIGREQFVDPPHEYEIVVVGRPFRPVYARARHTKQRALAPNRQGFVRAIEHLSTIRRAHLPDLLAKKSRSTVSCPILACSFSTSRSRAVSARRAPRPHRKLAL